LKRSSNSTNRDHDSDSSEGEQILSRMRTDRGSKSASEFQCSTWTPLHA
jgi:hypothetical protein